MFSDVFTYLPQGRHLRRPGEEESDVDIEGFEEEDDGKPKTPAPVREMQIVSRGHINKHNALKNLAFLLNLNFQYTQIFYNNEIDVLILFFRQRMPTEI